MLGLSLIPKLKYEHISLTSYSKMHVDLAAQVSAMVFHLHLCNSMYIQMLSESVANGLRSTEGDEVMETIKFVDYFDKSF